VRQIFHLRISERLGYRVIAERLNLDPGLYPPPTPTDPARAVGRWTGSAVREILKNPKYTGHMVWNRRATKKGGKVNPVAVWVLSPEPTHPAIITPEEFAAASGVGEHRERSRNSSEPNKHPATLHHYTLRSYLVCAACGRRMFGKTRRRLTSYACQPPDGRRPEGHPVSVLIPEPPLLQALETFFNT
jgi:site-specific DNA recombinase